MRINRATCNFILDGIYEDIILTPTNLKPNPTSPDRQLALTIYRLDTGCTYSTLSDLFGVSVSAASKSFNKICQLMVVSLYDRYVRLPTTDEEWQNEIRGFLENYEFPCVGAWDGFHVYINSQLKNHFSFKKRYSMTNLDLIGYNKRFLYAAMDAPGSTHVRLLKESSINSDIINGNVIPDRVVQLGDFGEIPLVTIGESAFPQFAWLIKAYNENTKDNQKKYFTKRLCGT